VHLAHWIYPGGIEGRRQLDRIKWHAVSNRSQRCLPDVACNNSRCDGYVGDRLGRQQLPRGRQRGDTCGDVDCRTKEVVRSAEYWAVVKPGPCQWNSWLGPAGWKQTSEHLKGGCRVGKSKHRFVTYPLDRRPDPSEGLAHQLLEAPKHRDCRRISIDVGNRAEARQIDERDGRDRGLEAVDRRSGRRRRGRCQLRLRLRPKHIAIAQIIESDRAIERIKARPANVRGWPPFPTAARARSWPLPNSPCSRLTD
jgi:hypothetical protein